jgi:Asp-tRNA(Asn)/Glu-tRNA(Gln) amidotransferase A subunit family amidase
MATQQQIVRPLLLKEALEWLRKGRIKPHELFEQTYQHAKKMQPITNAFLTFSPSHSSPSHEMEKERGEPKR